MNWGYKILTVYLVFVLGILFMVFKSSTQKTDLVTADYYGEELKYQHKIDENNNTAALSETVKYTYANNVLKILFPNDFTGKKLNGNLVMYCPADEKKDISMPFTTQSDFIELQMPAESKGLFEIHLSWTADGTNYYFEKKVLL